MKLTRKKQNRRAFLQSGVCMVAGLPIIYAANIPHKLQLLIEKNDSIFHNIEGKHPELRVLNDKPVNAETPVHLLNDRVTPSNLVFVRNNGIPPTNIDPDNWTLTVEGESAAQNVSITLKELKAKFKTYTLQLTIECGGNGRSEFNPPAKGNQWSTGAVACPSWTGVRLKDVLNFVGLKDDAVYLGYYGKDTHLSGDQKKVVISRGVPISKAMENESLIAWQMNEQDLPMHNGYPLRLVFGGWPASCSGKWLEKIVIRNKVHDGPKMGGQSYRVPCEKVAPGTKVADEDMCIIESMPVKSLITAPKTGLICPQKTLNISGKAWAGDLQVKDMHYSIDFGQTWIACALKKPTNRLAWQEWSATVEFPEDGYYEVWAKATDENNKSQPMVLPGWNPKGYLNNACHRIAVKVV